MDKNEIAHVGVLGMKWGVRRGDTSSSGSGKGRTSIPKSDKTLSEAEIKQQRIVTAKKALIVGGAIVGTGLAVYGTYKLSKFVKEHSKEIRAAKELIQFANSIGRSPKGTVPQTPSKPVPQAKKYTDVEWTKKKAEMLKEIKGEERLKPLSPELRARVRKNLLENNPIYRDLIKQQVEHEAIYGPPTPAEMKQAKESLMREGVKFPWG